MHYNKKLCLHLTFSYLLPLISYYLLLTTYHLPLTTYLLFLTTYYLPLITYPLTNSPSCLVSKNFLFCLPPFVLLLQKP